MNRAAHDAAEPNSCQNDREHDCESSRRRCNIQSQKPEPNHFQSKKNAARPKTDKKQSPWRPILRIQTERKRSLKNMRTGLAFAFCHKQSDCCGDATRQSRGQTRASKSKRRDEIAFTEQSANHRA